MSKRPKRTVAANAAESKRVFSSGGKSAGEGRGLRTGVKPGVRLALASAFFLSGASGLVYQVVWTRLSGLLFGSTVQAAAATLAVFMGGLALGARLASRHRDRIVRPAAVYAVIEALIGLYALAFPWLLQPVATLHGLLFQAFGDVEWLMTPARIGLAAMILLPPTMLMGATLPVMAAGFVGRVGKAGRDLGLLYAVNALGASLGAFLAAFVFIPKAGLDGALYLGAAVNGMLALGAYLAAGKRKIEPGQRPAESGLDAAKGSAGESPDTGRPRMLFALFFGIGFAGMLLENAWSRALTLVYGASIYAFATMLCAYLAGLGLGSLVMAGAADRIRRPRQTLGMLLLLGAAAASLTTPLIGRLPELFKNAFAGSFETIVLKEFLVAFAIMLVPTALSGAAFPLVAKAIAPGLGVVRAAAKGYVWNTLGAILGSLGAGFFFLPWLGTERTLLLAGAILGLLAALALGRRSRLGPAVAALSLAGFFLLQTWDPLVMNSGVYVYSSFFKGKTSVKDGMDAYTLLFTDEGHAASVAVLEKKRDGKRFLRVNGKTDGSDGSDAYTQTLLGVLPALYAKDLDETMVIGLGTGATLAALLDSGAKRVECVELSKEVVRASSFFAKDVGEPLRDLRVRLRIADGRTVLAAGAGLYDLISSEPSNPWQTGNANLFTREFFQAAVKRLKPGGIFCQWLPYYQMEPRHFELLVKTFAKEFPYVHVWLAYTDALLIGSTEAPTIPWDRLVARMNRPELKARLAKTGVVSPEALLSFFYLDAAGAHELVERTPGENSDFAPTIEFETPRYMVEREMRPDLFFRLLKLSYASKPPVVGRDLETLRHPRLEARRGFYAGWNIPAQVTEDMLAKSRW